MSYIEHPQSDWRDKLIWVCTLCGHRQHEVYGNSLYWVKTCWMCKGECKPLISREVVR